MKYERIVRLYTKILEIAKEEMNVGINVVDI